MLMSVLRWLRYSGISFIVAVNPMHWRWLPWGRTEYSEWSGPREHTWAGGWLFLTIRIWIDDGSW